MDYLKPSDFKQLKAFFLALLQSRFNLKQISTVVIMDGVQTPVDKTHCLELLRSFPDLSGEEFKDDNSLIKYLSDPGNIKRILGRLTTAQQIELTKVLEEKPVTTGEISEQPNEQAASAEQGVSAQTPAGTATGAMGVPGLPSAPSISSTPRMTRIIHNIPQTPEPSKPEISIANSSGVVKEAGGPSKLVRATRSGEIAEPGQPSKLVTANSSGRIVGGQGAETPPSKIYIANKSGSVVGERIIPSQRFNWRGFKIPASFTNAAKNFVSNTGIFAKRNIFGKILTPGRLVTGFTTALGAIAGSSVGGVGALAGAAAGFSLPSFIKSGGGGRFFTRLGNGTINVGVGFSNQFSRLSLPNPKKRYLVGLLLGLFLLVALGSILPLPKQESTEAAPLASPIPGTDISSCQFIRGSANPPGETYKSPLLLSYFQEAESITTVPAIVLAAIARVESPSVTRKGDADIPFLSSLAGCPTSPTGALGIMQLQPPGTTGYFAPGIQLGASFIGKTISQLTDRDFCDVRSSIIMAGGFILKKLQLRSGIGDGSKWNPSWTNNRDVVYKVAEGFYGCLDYPSCISGPYNYGDDIWISIQNCSPRQLASCPVPAGRITYPSYQADPINGHCTIGSTEYPCQAICPTTGRRAKSIDVSTIVTNREVRLPTINNLTASWKFIQVLCAGGGVYPSCSTARGATGALLTFEGTLSGTPDKWYLQFVHMEIPPLIELNKSYLSGTIIGQTDISIVHITIGKNIKFPYNSGSFTTDCDSGWMPADFMCK